MLLDYIDGLLQYVCFMASKKFSDGKNFNNLVSPPINILLMFLSSDQWYDYLIGQEVTGTEFQLVNGMTIPFTPEEIKLHINRMRKYPITREDIAYVKAAFRKYNEKLYGNETSNDEVASNVQNNTDNKKYIFDIEVLVKIYNVSIAENVFNCQLLDFIIAVGYANFNQITFTNDTRGKYLIYKMKKVMGETWYSESASSKNWTKNDCNRYGRINETTSWANRIYQVIEKNTKPH